jgi:hypothetical protein
VIVNMQEGMEGVETKLRSVRKMLQEKVNQLKEQVSLPFIQDKRQRNMP